MIRAYVEVHLKHLTKIYRAECIMLLGGCRTLLWCFVRVNGVTVFTMCFLCTYIAHEHKLWCGHQGLQWGQVQE